MSITHKRLTLTVRIICSFLAAVILVFFAAAVKAASIDFKEVFTAITAEKGYWIAVVLITALLAAVSSVPDSFRQFLFKWRFVIAAALFLILVILGINGSSIGNWHLYFEDPDTHNLFGESRLVRTDEWALFTPMSLSQYLNPNGRSAYFSPLLRGVDTDMFMLYGQAALHPAVFFRPFSWGYLFLPADNALAWFWSGRFIALLLVSFEFGRLITENKNRYALCYSLLLGLSPFVQWWFSINGLVEMLIACQLSVLLFKRYLETGHTGKRAFLAAGICWCAGAFILAFYPSWMVPLFYLIILLVIWTLVKNRGIARITWKDILVLTGVSAVTVVTLGSAFLKSKDYIVLMMNTVYPGDRYMNGGEGGFLILRYIESLWQPVDNVISEVDYSIGDTAQIISLSPLPYVTACLLFFREKKKDLLSILLFAVCLFFMYFSLFGIPEFIDRLLLLNLTGGNRLIPVLTLFELILLFRSISLLEKPLKPGWAILISVLSAVLVFVYNYLVFFRFPSRRLFLLTFMIIAGLMLLFLVSVKRKRVVAFLVSAVCLVTLISGGLVNPIRSGASDVTEIPALQEIRKIDAEEHGLWAVISDYPRINIPVLAGVPCINSTNIYPNLEAWRTLDIQGVNEDIYNRYAHISMSLKADGPAEFSLLGPDYFHLDITLDDLRKLGVGYIIVQEASLGSLDETCVYAGECQSYYFYRID